MDLGEPRGSHQALRLAAADALALVVEQGQAREPLEQELPELAIRLPMGMTPGQRSVLEAAAEAVKPSRTEDL
jgi:hypothetical protein